MEKRCYNCNVQYNFHGTCNTNYGSCVIAKIIIVPVLIPVAYQGGDDIITHVNFNKYNSQPKIYLNCVSAKINNKN